MATEEHLVRLKQGVVNVLARTRHVLTLLGKSHTMADLTLLRSSGLSWLSGDTDLKVSAQATPRREVRSSHTAGESRHASLGLEVPPA